MKKIFLRTTTVLTLCFGLTFPRIARSDFWGGDLPLLAQIIVNTTQQLIQLKEILGTGRDTLGIIRDINSGVRDAMNIIRTMNTTFQPGVLGEIESADQLLRVIQDLYGMIPQTPEARMQQMNDQNVAEAITLHNQAFKYASMVDPEAEKIKDYAKIVSPLGAAKLTAQSLGVLIHVMNQVLRTNASMLKIMSSNLALQNRHEKVSSEQFKMQYEGLSKSLGELKNLNQSTEINPTPN